MQKEFKNLFCDFTDSELEKCYRSRIRILNKTNEDYEPYKDMVKNVKNLLDMNIIPKWQMQFARDICLTKLLNDFLKL